jgi:hypothetical protein
VDELTRLRDEYGVPRRIHRAVFPHNEASGRAEGFSRPTRRPAPMRPDHDRRERERPPRADRRDRRRFQEGARRDPSASGGRASGGRRGT